MRKIFLFALGALMSMSAWSFDNVPATFSWTVGNESEATISSDADGGVKESKVAIGVGLSIVGTKSNYEVNNGHAMVQYKPAETNKGVDASVMIEYRVTMKKGVTFSLTGISYDALKDGTDGASYHWSYAVDGVESDATLVPAENLLRNNGNNSSTAQLNHTHAVTAAAGQVVAFRIYVSGFNNQKKFALSNIILTGTINGEEESRSFTNFKIDFRSNPYTMVEPETQPANVTVANENYNGNQHGLQGGTITVNVDGPVKFTLGTCNWGTTIAVQKDGVDFASIANKGGCDNSGVEGGYTKFVTWIYNVEEAATLTFTVNGSYLPYFFAEACEYVPQVEVRYFDTDGQTLIGEPQIVEGGSALAFAYGASDVTVAEGKAFRGWFNSVVPTATKVAEGTPLTENLNLYAKATDVEIAETGKIFSYDLTKNYFYADDHELFSSEGGAFYNAQHGWVFGNGHTLSIEVAGNALLSVGVCTYSNTAVTLVKDADDNVVGQLDVVKNQTADGSEQTIRYTGEATVLTFYFTATSYIHSIKVYNVESIPTKNELGYFEVAADDAAGFLLALASAESGDKIFLPDGTYDLGEACLTPISTNNISIIGQSMENTIIRNAPDFHNEGIGSTATLLITANNTYLQDLTIQNALDYFGAINAGLGGARAVCLQDKGSQTICKNVKLLSNQDTYYSNKIGAVKYFADCEIHGTVDFICGDGSVYFYGTELVCEQRNPNGSGVDAITASNADANDKGYVFNYSTVKYAEGIEGTLPVVSLGRSWNNSPKCIFLNTFLSDENGALNMTKNASAQKDIVARWTLGAMNVLPTKFGEYNSVNGEGAVVSPESNNVTFVLGTAEKQMETILTAEEAATYTMAYTLGSWAETAENDARQDSAFKSNIEPNAIYLVEIEGNPYILRGSEIGNHTTGDEYKLRKANARGGFGPEAEDHAEEGTGIGSCQHSAISIQKIFRDGQVIIVRGNKEYNVLGAEL